MAENRRERRAEKPEKRSSGGPGGGGGRRELRKTENKIIGTMCVILFAFSSLIFTFLQIIRLDLSFWGKFEWTFYAC